MQNGNNLEVEMVLDRITDSAKTRFDYEGLEFAFGHYVGADSFCVLNVA